MAAGRYPAEFKEEAMALNTAATEILGNFGKILKKVVFFSDALSVQNPKKEGAKLISQISCPK